MTELELTIDGGPIWPYRCTLCHELVTKREATASSVFPGELFHGGLMCGPLEERDS